MTQYLLWITPDGKAYDRLAELISRLGQQYQGPMFEPHITLLGGIEAEESCLLDQIRRLADTIPPVLVHLQQPSCEDEYFRCMYFSVEETPALLGIHEQARGLFDKRPGSPFQPHLSLLYGQVSMAIQQEIIAALPPDIPNPFFASYLTLIRAETLNPGDWHLVERVQLHGGES